MIHRTLRQCVEDLKTAGQLVVLDEPVDAYLEAAEIQRRLYASGGPAVLMTRVKNCRFPMLCNLFGTLDRAHFIFRDTLENVRRLIELKVDGSQFLKRPMRYGRAGRAALQTRPRRCHSGPVLGNRIAVSDLPQLVSWPDDGGPYITLPQVYTEDPDHPGLARSNLGMYRVQLAGGQYRQDQEVGLHYQLHRGIAVHHAAALRRGQPLAVNIFIGGTPAMMVAAVMPLPEGVSELMFAGPLAGHRIPMIRRPDALAVYAEADFCISGTLAVRRELPEGPFGDHLGYYSMAHEFPVLEVSQVTCRDGAIWPFTVVGRPPQEDTVFGQLIHELTAPIVPTVVPGIRAVHAVDAAGVHPLMLAIGSERYVPYVRRDKPRELLTQACAVLGQGQMSLAKYLWITAGEDAPNLNVKDVPQFLQHVLERVDWRRDLHFHTRTTIDTLDYSGDALNEGSKVVIAAAGAPIRELATALPGTLSLPDEFAEPRICLPGVMAVEGPRFAVSGHAAVRQFCASFAEDSAVAGVPLIVVVDDSRFVAQSLANCLWVTFTRSNPAPDIDGIGAFTDTKHWGCRGSLVIDARLKPHHAPPLIEDDQVTSRIDALAARGGVIARWL